MPKVGPGEVQYNFVLPEELDERIKDYQFKNRITYKAEAYRQLLEKGLEASEKAPKS